MNILFEINHPAHFHLFKNSVDKLTMMGHTVFVSAKTNSIIIQLLTTKPHWKISYIGFSGKTIAEKAIKQIFFLLKTILFIQKNKIQLCIGVSIIFPLSAFITRIKSIVFDDDDVSVTPCFALLSHTFASIIFSPNCLSIKSSKKKFSYYKGYHELAYLHKNIFKPDKQIIEKYNLSEDEVLFFVRFNEFKSHHDIGESGLSNIQRKQLVLHLKRYGKVLISMENSGLLKLEDNTISIQPEEVHHFLAFASLYIGESLTMTTEAAVLGIPSIRINTFKGRLSVHEELENRYDLIYSFLPSEFEQALKKVDELIKADTKSNWRKKRNTMLKEKINVQDFITKSITNFA